MSKKRRIPQKIRPPEPLPSRTVQTLGQSLSTENNHLRWKNAALEKQNRDLRQQRVTSRCLGGRSQKPLVAPGRPPSTFAARQHWQKRRDELTTYVAKGGVMPDVYSLALRPHEALGPHHERQAADSRSTFRMW